MDADWECTQGRRSDWCLANQYLAKQDLEVLMAQPSETPFIVPQPNPNEKLVKVFDSEQ